MLVYLTRRFFINVLVIAFALALLPVAFAGVPIEDAIPRAVFWAGFIGAAVTYYDFRRRNLWPLYDNLRLPRYWLLIGLVVVNLFIFVGTRMWL